MMRAIAVLGTLLLTQQAAAQGTITDGTSSFGLTAFTSTSNGTFVSRGGSDLLYQLSWFYRAGADSSETILPSPTTQSWSGNQALVGWEDVHGKGFDVLITITLVEGTTGAYLEHEVAVVSDADLDLDLFAYMDLDINGASNDSAVAIDSQTMRVSDANSVDWRAPTAEAYQVTSYSALRTALSDGAVTDLDNTGLPYGPGDWTGAVQWSLSLSAGVSQAFTMDMTADGETLPVCGNSSTEVSESCDDGFTDACGTCNADCSGAGTGSTCGDGTTCPETESCDDGFADACGTCNADCSNEGAGATCGDGEICDELEECDDGNTSDLDGCSASCMSVPIVDAGVPDADGGLPSEDGGFPPDGAVMGGDGGLVDVDAGPHRRRREDGGGCGCRTVPSDERRPAAWIGLVLLASVLGARRRHRR